MTIACVLRTGGEYKPEHVWKLYEACKNFSFDYDFVCFSDSDQVPNRVALKHDWPKWWPKIELFNTDYDKILFIDLDTVILDDFSELADYSGDFMMLSDFYSLTKPASGLMLFKPKKFKRVYDIFVANPDFYMTKYKAGGDQEFINSLGIKVDRFQTLYPNKVISYKEHCCDNRKNKKFIGLPNKGESIVCFHGKPRPWELKGENDVGRRY